MQCSKYILYACVSIKYCVSVLDVKLSNISVQDIYASSWDCEDVWAVSTGGGYEWHVEDIKYFVLVCIMSRARK